MATLLAAALAGIKITAKLQQPHILATVGARGAR